MHCDLDCFFAAVEELDNPHLTGKPVIVGGDPGGRGVVSTANYPARRFGVHSGMSAGVAKRICPQAIFLRPRFDRYRELSQRVMAVLDEYFLIRERVSIDEAYGELSRGVPGCRLAEDIAREIRQRVREEVGLVISVGVAQSKSVAKLASDISKPDGLLVVKPGTETAFLRPLPISRLSGVGPHTQEKLARMGVFTIGDLANLDPEDVQTQFGRHGAHLWRMANAQDDRPVVSDHGPPKSVSRETTFSRDVTTVDRAIEHADQLAREVLDDLMRLNLTPRTAVVKVRWSDFSIMTRQRTVPNSKLEQSSFLALVREIIETDLAHLFQQGESARLIGVGVSIAPTRSPQALTGYEQLRLFSFDDGELLQIT